MISNHNPGNFVRVFAQYVRNVVEFLTWATIGFVALATTYVAVRAVLVAVRAILQALGIAN